MSQNTSNDDWRLQGQERYLNGATLIWKRYRRPSPEWDHDHCNFCWKKFAELTEPEILHDGYATEDEYHWVCADCANDFADRFSFKFVGGPLAR